MNVQHENVGLDREELRKEIRSELSHRGRRRLLLSAFVYLAVLIVLLLVPVIGLATLAARSGLAEVPVLTDWLYHPEPPRKVVRPIEGMDTNSLLTVVASRITRDPVTGIMRLSLTEQELTTLLSSAVDSAAADDPSLSSAVSTVQASFGDDGAVDLYVVTGSDYGGVPISARVRPDVVDSRLTLQAEDLTVGSMVLPDFLADMMVKSVLSRMDQAVTGLLGDSGRLESVGVEAGRLNVLFIIGS
ncbi:MAG: hypothetical protein ABIJ46_00020 [bacterium]